MIYSARQMANGYLQAYRDLLGGTPGTHGPQRAEFRFGVIRILVVYSKTFYFLDRGSEHGITYEALKLFEDDINKQPAVRKQLKAKHLRVNLVFLPVSLSLGGAGCPLSPCSHSLTS